MNNGSIALSLLLMAVGAILAWAVETSVAGIDIKVVGAILMVVGVIGLSLSLLFWASFAPFARRDDRERHDLVERCSSVPPTGRGRQLADGEPRA